MHRPILFIHKAYKLRSLVILLELCMRRSKNHFKIPDISEGWKGTGGNAMAPWGALRALYPY